MNEIVLDNTKRGDFRQCKMKYYLRHVRGLQPNYGSTAIRFGVAWHGIMEGYYGWIIEHGFPNNKDERVAAMEAGLILGLQKYEAETRKKEYIDDYKNFNNAAESFEEYLAWSAQDLTFMEILHTEKVFDHQLLPESAAEEELMSKLPPVRFTGKIDLCLNMDHQVWIQDFKTTAWILSQAVLKSNRSPQLIGYSYAADKVFGFNVNGCLILFCHLSAYKSKKTGEYGSPKFEFRRVPQVYSPGDITEWKLSFLDTVREIVYCTETGFWAESFDNCYQYGPCAYLKLCQQHRPIEEMNLTDFHEDFWDVLEEDD